MKQNINKINNVKSTKKEKPVYTIRRVKMTMADLPELCADLDISSDEFENILIKGDSYSHVWTLFRLMKNPKYNFKACLEVSDFWPIFKGCHIEKTQFEKEKARYKHLLKLIELEGGRVFFTSDNQLAAFVNKRELIENKT